MPFHLKGCLYFNSANIGLWNYSKLWYRVSSLLTCGPWDKVRLFRLCNIMGNILVQPRVKQRGGSGVGDAKRGRQVGSGDECLVPTARCVCVCLRAHTPTSFFLSAYSHNSIMINKSTGFLLPSTPPSTPVTHTPPLFTPSSPPIHSKW